jgi:eukaryotic-like serine/threonine-protein kinase
MPCSKRSSLRSSLLGGARIERWTVNCRDAVAGKEQGDASEKGRLEVVDSASLGGRGYRSVVLTVGRAKLTSDDRDGDNDVEETTRPLLESDRRLRRSVPVAADDGPPPREPFASSARLSVSSSSVDSTSDGPVSEAALRISPETTRLGPYQIVCELASGGMATVYLALYRSVEGFEKLCAVKRIHPHLANDRAFTNMFADEAQIAARISHPFVCSVFSFGRSQRSHYIAMEFLRGEPLSAVCRRVARSPELGDDPRFPALAARVLANLAEGLHAAHTLRDDSGTPFDVVHRDVTPQNLFVLYDGSVRVTDFGIAHARRRLHQTEGQKLKGKLSYIAPEQLNAGTVDRLVDIWSLGVTLWELLAGRRLFLGASEGETLSAVMSREVRPPSTFRASVPKELDRIVLRALERDVSKRYKTARDFARDLERFLASIGDSVPAMDVADWMAQVFPRGAERIQTLMELTARVSAATADDTVVRVPSSPPARDPGSVPSFVMLAAHHDSSVPPGELSRRPSSQPTAALRGVPPLLPKPAPLPNVPLAAANEDGAMPATRSAAEPSAAARSRPHLLLLEEQTLGEVGRAARAQAFRSLAVLVGLGLLVVGVGGVWWQGRILTAREAPVPAGAPVATAVAPEDVQRAAPEPAASPQPALTRDLASPVEAATSKVAESKPVARARAATTSAPKAPALAPKAPASAAEAAIATGVVFITTPGGSGEVFEHGQLLGKAPGSFRLKVGAHQLTLRTPSGASRALSVQVQGSAPTLVTVPDAK